MTWHKFKLSAGKNLKVRMPEKYGWEPRRLLSQLADIYLHLYCEGFAAALAGDEVCDFAVLPLIHSAVHSLHHTLLLILAMCTFFPYIATESQHCVHHYHTLLLKHTIALLLRHILLLNHSSVHSFQSTEYAEDKCYAYIRKLESGTSAEYICFPNMLLCSVRLFLQFTEISYIFLLIVHYSLLYYISYTACRV
jgi:hypothetical protein